jgi:hypothetical protein
MFIVSRRDLNGSDRPIAGIAPSLAYESCYLCRFAAAGDLPR